VHDDRPNARFIRIDEALTLDHVVQRSNLFRWPAAYECLGPLQRGEPERLQIVEVYRLGQVKAGEVLRA